MSGDGKHEVDSNRPRFKWGPELKLVPSVAVTRDAKKQAVACKHPHKSVDEEDVEGIIADYLAWRQAHPTNFGGQNYEHRH